MAKGGATEGAGRKMSAAGLVMRQKLHEMSDDSLQVIRDILADPDHKDRASVARWVVGKSVPEIKPSAAPITVDFPEDATVTLLSGLQAALKIEMDSEIIERLEKIEAAQGVKR